jgi:N-acetylglucosamine-6-phosphate deacetylase
MPTHGHEVVRAATLLTPEGPLSPGELVVDGGRIVEIRTASGPAPDVVAAPGFIDLQVNGVEDVDCAVASGDDWRRAGEHLVRTGVTAWLPTLVSQPLDRYARPLDAIATAMDVAAGPAVILGAHLEGPFLGGRPGAHRPLDIVPPDLDWLRAIPHLVRLVTLAPEQPGAPEAVELLSGRGVVVSLGHSSADLETALAAVDRGARMVTHLFNGMAPLHHREPGILGAGLADDRLSAGLIADGVHVHPSLLPVVFRAKGAGRVVLVTDSVGWRTGHLQDRGLAVVDGAPRLPDGTLAGSVLTMDTAVRNVVDAGVPLADALAAASTTPSTLLGDRDRGRLRVGARADVVVLDADDLSVIRTLVAGRTVWER